MVTADVLDVSFGIATLTAVFQYVSEGGPCTYMYMYMYCSETVAFTTSISITLHKNTRMKEFLAKACTLS